MGALNSLAQVTLKATLPGVPDFYQGTELWDLSLVDPDNRRPVDFDRRASMLSSLSESVPIGGSSPRAWPDGRIKLALISRLLALRGESRRGLSGRRLRPARGDGSARERNSGVRAGERAGSGHRRGRPLVRPRDRRRAPLAARRRVARNGNARPLYSVRSILDVGEGQRPAREVPVVADCSTRSRSRYCGRSLQATQ